MNERLIELLIERMNDSTFNDLHCVVWRGPSASIDDPPVLWLGHFNGNSCVGDMTLGNPWPSGSFHPFLYFSVPTLVDSFVRSFAHLSIALSLYSSICPLIYSPINSLV